MKKQTIVDQVGVSRDGHLNVRFAKQVLDDDGSVLSSGWHRTVLEPGQDIDEQMAAVNAHLEAMNCKPVERAEIARIKALAPVVWTKTVVADHRAKAAREVAELEASMKPAPSTEILGAKR